MMSQEFINVAIKTLNSAEIQVSSNYFYKEIPFSYKGEDYSVIIEDNIDDISKQINNRERVNVTNGDRTCSVTFKADTLLGGKLKLITKYNVFSSASKVKFISATAELDPPLGYTNGGVYADGSSNPINSEVNSYGKYTILLAGAPVPVKLTVNTMIGVYTKGILEITHSR